MYRNITIFFSYPYQLFKNSKTVEIEFIKFFIIYNTNHFKFITMLNYTLTFNNRVHTVNNPNFSKTL